MSLPVTDRASNRDGNWEGLGEGGYREKRKNGVFPVQKCPNYKMCRGQNVRHPPYSPNAWVKSAHFLARPLMGIY